MRVVTAIVCVLLNHKWRPAAGPASAAQTWRCDRCGKEITGTPHAPTLHEKTGLGPFGTRLP